jgi:hypothetical protein
MEAFRVAEAALAELREEEERSGDGMAVRAGSGE